MKFRSIPFLIASLALALPSPFARANQNGDTVLAPILQPYVDNHVMSGAVALIADKDRIIHLEAVGFADLATNRRLRTDDVFWIASMTKPVTGVAIMMLVDEGRVKLDDPVSSYLPEFKNLKVLRADGTLTPLSHPPTIREVLSHTSGMRFLNTKDRSVIDSVPLKTSIEHNLLEPLLSDPGTSYRYSNEGIDTAGRIVEVVTGLPFERFLQERLFTPLGMNDTTFFPNTAQLTRLATSYKNGPAEKPLVATRIQYLTYPLDGPSRYAAPGGGLFSTARDVARFCQMLASDGTFEGSIYLSKESVRQMTSKQTGPLVENMHGLGIGASPDGTRFGWNGAYKTDMVVDHGQIRVFLVQHADNWKSGNPKHDFEKLALDLLPASPKAFAATP